MIINSNYSNTKNAYIGKVVIGDESNVKEKCINIIFIIEIAKKKVDIIIIVIINIIASILRINTNTILNININKMVNNMRKCILIYKQLQISM